MDKDLLQDAYSELRSGAPKVSFDDTSRRFLKAQNVGGTGIALALFFRKWNYLHWIIMTASIIGVTALSLVLSLSTEKENTQHPVTSTVPVEETAPQPQEETIEIEYFTADSQLIQRVRKEKGHTTIEQLQPLSIDNTLPQTAPGSLHSSFVPDDDTLSTTPVKRCYKVYKNMDDTDLPAIDVAAKAAGLEFRYKYLVWKGKVKKLEYWIKWTGEDGKYCNYYVELKGKFTACIGWYEDENGMAVRLLE